MSDRLGVLWRRVVPYSGHVDCVVCAARRWEVIDGKQPPVQGRAVRRATHYVTFKGAPGVADLYEVTCGEHADPHAIELPKRTVCPTCRRDVPADVSYAVVDDGG